jgi:hypothetical protein
MAKSHAPYRGLVRGPHVGNNNERYTELCLSYCGIFIVHLYFINMAAGRGLKHKL